MKLQNDAPLSRLIFRLGMTGTIVLITLLAILLSNLLTCGISMLRGSVQEYLDYGMVTATLVSTIGVPLFSYFVLFLLFELEKTRKQLEKLSQTDELTGIFNRRHFYALGDAEVAKAHRYRLPLSMLLIDLDHFKRINDRYGHDIGDIALMEVVALCRSTLREADIMARLGGEEFGVLLPMTSGPNAEIVAEKLRHFIASHRIFFDGDHFHTTISIGVASLKDTDNLSTLIKQADRNLYAAKNHGRNRVVAETN